MSRRKREQRKRWRRNMHALADALRHARDVHGYRCDCAHVSHQNVDIDWSKP